MVTTKRSGSATWPRNSCATESSVCVACGVAVLTSSTSALQEIAGGYAYLCDPMDVDAIARGVAELATDPARRAEFASLGLKRAGDFSWDHAAQQTLEVYASALARPER